MQIEANLTNERNFLGFMITDTLLPSENNPAPEFSLEFCPTLTSVRVSTSLRTICQKFQLESEQEGGISLSLVLI